jgi:hypothetical protein
MCIRKTSKWQASLYIGGRGVRNGNWAFFCTHRKCVTLWAPSLSVFVYRKNGIRICFSSWKSISVCLVSRSTWCKGSNYDSASLVSRSTVGNCQNKVRGYEATWCKGSNYDSASLVSRSSVGKCQQKVGGYEAACSSASTATHASRPRRRAICGDRGGSVSGGGQAGRVKIPSRLVWAGGFFIRIPPPYAGRASQYLYPQGARKKLRVIVTPKKGRG